MLSLITVPILLSSLGVTNYGYYLILSSLIFIATITDIGLSNGAINRIAISQNDKDFSDIILGLFFSLIAVSTATLILFLCIFPFLDWGLILNLDANTLIRIQREIFISGVACALIPFTNVASKILVAKSHTTRAANLILIAAISTNSLLIFFAYFKASIGLLIAVQIVSPTIINIFVLFRIVDLSRIYHLNFRFYIASLQQNLHFGSVFVVLQLTTILSYQVDNLILGHFLGPTAVVELATVWKLCIFPTLLVSAGVAPLWGQSAIWHSQGGEARAIREAIITIRQLRIPLAVFSLGFCILGKPFVKLWTNGLVNPSAITIVVAVCWVSVYTISQPIAMLLNGIGRFHFVVTTAILTTISNVVLSVLFTQIFRVPAGPLLGSFVAQIVFYLIPFWVFFVYKLSRKG